MTAEKEGLRKVPHTAQKSNRIIIRIFVNAVSADDTEFVVCLDH